MKISFLFLAFISLFTLSSCSAPIAHQSHQDIGINSRYSSLIEIFDRAQELGQRMSRSNYIVSEPVYDFILSKTKTKEGILALVTNSGFRIGPNIVEARDYRKQGYDEVYVGERSRGIVLYRQKKYKVALYFKDGVLKKVTANAYGLSL